MKAVIFSAYGSADLLRIQEVNKPEPTNNEVLVKIHYSSVTSGEARIRSLNVPEGFGLFVRLGFGFSKPRVNILGGEFSGVIEKIGSEVSKFKVGDEVFGFSGTKFGTNAEYFCINEDGCIIHKPANINFEDAAAIPFGANTALYFLRGANIQKEDKILINGASGSVGTAAVQIAKYFEAHVTAVCSSKNSELVKELGADEVINYDKESLLTGKEKYDIIFDTVGNISIDDAFVNLKEGGRFTQLVGGLPFYISMVWRNFVNKLMGKSKRIVSGVGADNKELLNFTKNLMEEGKYKAVIGKVFTLDQIVEAHKYVDSGHKIGSVVIQIK